MAVFLYNLFIGIYGLLIQAAALFNKKAALFVKGRKGLLEKIQQAMKDNTAPVAWFHVASLGEFEQARPVIEAFKQAYPDHYIYITFFSPSGYELRKDYEGADFVSYLPLDKPGNAKKLLAAVKPSLIVFVKYEFWYHYLHQAQELKVPLYCISAVFTDDHIFFKSYGSLHRRMLGFFDHIFVQDQASKKLLESIDLPSVSVSGDTRFDRVVKTLQQPECYPILETFKEDKALVIIGSSWPEDMALLYPIINQSYPDLKFVIAPHLVDEAAIEKLESGLSKKSLRITDATEEAVQHADILIINTIGMLSNIYQYGSFAYIGGAFGDGLHNILEAVTFGLPVVFGNKGLEKFPESIELSELGGAFAVNNGSELKTVFDKLYKEPEFRNTASAICNRFIEDNTGATEFFMDHLKAQYER